MFELKIGILKSHPIAWMSPQRFFSGSLINKTARNIAAADSRRTDAQCGVRVRAKRGQRE